MVVHPQTRRHPPCDLPQAPTGCSAWTLGSQRGRASADPNWLHLGLCSGSFSSLQSVPLLRSLVARPGAGLGAAGRWRLGPGTGGFSCSPHPGACLHLLTPRTQAGLASALTPTSRSPVLPFLSPARHLQSISNKSQTYSVPGRGSLCRHPSSGISALPSSQDPDV